GLELEAGHRPGHRAILQCVDRVLHPHADEYVGAEDAAGAAGAVHDDRRVLVLWRVDQRADADRQFRPRDIERAGHVGTLVLLASARVEDQDALAALLPLDDLLWRQVRRLALDGHLFAVVLAGHVGAVVGAPPGRGPGFQAAVQETNILIAHRLQRLGRQPGAMTVDVVEDDRDVTHRDALWHSDLQQSARDRHRPEDVPLDELTLFANVDQRVRRLGLAHRAQL